MSAVVLPILTACSAPPDDARAGTVEEGLSGAQMTVGPAPTTPTTPTLKSVTAPAAGSDAVVTCARYDVPVPRALKGLGCTAGLEEVDAMAGRPFRYVFACPGSDLQLTAPLGLLTPPNALEVETARFWTQYADNCVGAPKPGWGLVVDELRSVNPVGCHGGCGDPAPMEP